ncbi:MAG: hypothetical protein M9894_20025 [Planctomycetes bacterium]|nr:hypothetical protein [Planctomycetota bacterium]
MDVRARPHDEGGSTRCPYCHDSMGEQTDEVTCGACGTTHHAACLEELGRCTVLGCAWTPTGAPAPALTRTVEEYRRAVRERKVRRFAKGLRRVDGPARRRQPWSPDDQRRTAARAFLESIGLGGDPDAAEGREAALLVWVTAAFVIVAGLALLAGALL